MQTQIEAPRRGVKIYSYRDMPSRKRAPRDVLRAISNGNAGCVAASKAAGSSGMSPGATTSQVVKHWYRTDTLTASGSNVVTITDQGSAGKNVAVTGTAPTITASDSTISNLQTVQLASGKGLFNSTSISIAPPFTMMLVANLTTWAGACALFGSLTPLGLLCGGSSPLLYQNLTTYSNFQSMTVGTWFLIWAEFTNSTSDRIKIGSNAYTTTPGTNSGPSTLTSIGFNLAAGAGASAFSLREAAVWPGLITEQAAVTSYVAAQSASIQH